MTPPSLPSGVALRLASQNSQARVSIEFRSGIVHVTHHLSAAVTSLFLGIQQEAAGRTPLSPEQQRRMGHRLDQGLAGDRIVPRGGDLSPAALLAGHDSD